MSEKSRMALQLEDSQIGEVSIPGEQCRALVKRVTESHELHRASRLREFLLYVCQQTLEQGVTNIHEQEIGAAVFGRRVGYDTNVDNIVRVNATSLRKRLERYFAEEGAREEIILEIPRGVYTPVFRRRAAAEQPDPSAFGVAEYVAPKPVDDSDPIVVARPVVVPATPSRRSFGWLWPTATAVLLIACAGLVWQNRSMNRRLQRWTTEPAIRALWGEFFRQGGETDVIVADTSFALSEDMMQRTVSLTDYLNYNYKRFAEDSALSAEKRNDLGMVLERNNGSVGDFRVAQQILSLNSDAKQVSLKFARDFTTDAAKQNNLVLIGSQESNPWVGLFADKVNFSLQYDPATRRAFVVNRSPLKGEPAEYATPSTGRQATEGYGVIAYLPNMSGHGKALILEGTDSQATGAAGDFMTSEEVLAAFESRFPPGPIPSFEILLRTLQLSGTPLRAEIAAYRIYANGKPDPRSATAH